MEVFVTMATKTEESESDSGEKTLNMTDTSSDSPLPGVQGDGGMYFSLFYPGVKV